MDLKILEIIELLKTAFDNHNNPEVTLTGIKVILPNGQVWSEEIGGDSQTTIN